MTTSHNFEITLYSAVSVAVLFDFSKYLVSLNKFAKYCLVSVKISCFVESYHKFATVARRSLACCCKETTFEMSQVKITIWIEDSECSVVFMVDTSSNYPKSWVSFCEVGANI